MQMVHRDLNCKFGDKSHFWHPKKLKKINQTTENKNEKPFTKEEGPRIQMIYRFGEQMSVHRLI